MTGATSAPRYRPNVCAVITDDSQRRVLMFRRVDATLGEFRWQFPQGGLDSDETPEQGLLRELTEEIGTNDVLVLRQLPQPLRYDYPPDILTALATKDPRKAGFSGQEQHWFLVQLRVSPSHIHFNHSPPEFDAWEWVTPDQAVARVVPFKRVVYQKALSALGML
ncbi:MAG: RNA pyrophosphohydrolase [Deltaproteobacteria bacterium]|nr:RNA pyrophosphohydrolase [Deltaproteobacteria bacterium]